MKYWLLKTEPEEWSWQDQAANGGSQWDGVRNAQAQKLMKVMSIGDRCFFYHTGKAKEIVGIVEVSRPFYPDASDSSGKCGMVDVQEVCAFDEPVTLAALKKEPGLEDFVLFRQPRLSVVPVTEEIWHKICSLGAVKDEDRATAVNEDENEQQQQQQQQQQKKKKKKKRRLG